MESKFLDQDVDVVFLANKGIVIESQIHFKYCCISSIITKSACWMHKIAELQMLRFARRSKFDGAQFWILLFIIYLAQFNRK